MPEKDCFVDASTINCFSLGRIEPKVTLKSLVRLFGEGVTLSVKADAGNEVILTPYKLAMLEHSEVFGIAVYGCNHAAISLVEPKKEANENV